jgi:hypothetical protein
MSLTAFDFFSIASGVDLTFFTVSLYLSIKDLVPVGLTCGLTDLIAPATFLAF